MSTTFDQETGHGYEYPRCPYRGRNYQKAHERGFDAYVWTTRTARTPETQDRQARSRYFLPGLQRAFREGWDAAAALDPERTHAR